MKRHRASQNRSIVTGGFWTTRRERVLHYMLRHPDTFLIYSITVLLGVLPLLFWTGVTTSSMNLGGDNGLLYFAYPSQWMAHTSVTALSQNLSGYNPIPQYVPLSFLLLLIHMTGLNAEGAFLGLVLAALFLGTVNVAGQVLQLAFSDRDAALFAAPSFLAGVIVVAAPVLAQTQWSAILPGLWWEALLPWLLVCYLRHQATGKLRFAIGAALVSSLLASAIVDAPITIGCTLAAILLIASLHITGASRIQPLRGLAFAAVVIATSAFWTVPFAASFFLSQLQVQGALSPGGKEVAAALVRTLAPLQSPLAAIEMRLGTNFMLAFGWPQPVASRWSSVLGWIGALPSLLTLLALGMRVWVAPKSRPTVLLGLLTFSTCVAFVLLVPNVAPGEQLMLFLTRVVPGWTATRNFYNVFGLPLVFLLALTTSLAVSTISLSRQHFLISRPVVFGISVALLVYNAPFLVGSYFRLPYQLNGSYNRVVTGLPQDYMAMLARLRVLAPGPVLSLPLSAPAWTVIPEPAVPKQIQGVYIGISPVYFLTGRSDYNGVAAFANPIAPSLPDDVQSALTTQNTQAFVQLMRSLGVRYVILNTAPLARSGYYGIGAVSSSLMEATETSAIARALAPTILASRGSFQLRSVANALSYPVRVLPTGELATNSGFILQTALGLPTAPLRTCPTWSVRVHSSSPWRLTVRLTPRFQASYAACTLVLEYPRSTLWTATLESKVRVVMHSAAGPVLGLFTGFNLPTRPAKPLSVVIQYQGQVFVTAGFGASGLAWIVLMVAATIRRWPMRRVSATTTAVHVPEEEE